MRRRPVAWGISLALALALGAGVPIATTVLAGVEPYERLVRDYPGLDVGVLTTALRLVADLAGITVAGALVMIMFLTPASRRAAPGPPLDLTVLRIAAALWATTAGVLVVFSALDAAGIPLYRLDEPGTLAYAYQASDAPLAWTFVTIAGLVVFIGAQLARSWVGLLLPLWATAIGLLAPVVTGQILVGPEHDLGGDSGTVQTLAVAVAAGPVLVAALRSSTGRLVSPVVLRRMFWLLVCLLPVAAGAQAVVTWFKLAGTPLLASPTGPQLVAQWACLGLLAVFTWVAARWWSAGRLRELHVVGLLAVAGVTVVAWVGIGVAMTRIPPPVYFVPTSISQVFMGFDLPGPPTAQTLLAGWRVNLLFALLATVPVGGYLVGVGRLRRRAVRWPVGRAIAWVLGWVVVVLATSSGLGYYSTADFGVHMVVHMGLNMLAPLLLVLGGPVTLALRVAQTKQAAAPGAARVFDRITQVLHWRPLQVASSPLVVFAIFIGSYYGLYLTPAFGELMRFHWAHQLMNLHFLVVGYAYYALIIGVDRPPRPLPHIGRLGYVLAAMPFHAFFGVILMTSNTIIGETFYRYLDLPWADLAASQYLGGGVAWAGGELPLMIVILVLGVQWARQDSREAERKDRHYDTGRDDEFDEYNRMLQQLADRDTVSR